jgi:hypothetical protein
MPGCMAGRGRFTGCGFCTGTWLAPGLAITPEPGGLTRPGLMADTITGPLLGLLEENAEAWSGSGAREVFAAVPASCAWPGSGARGVFAIKVGGAGRSANTSAKGSATDSSTVFCFSFSRSENVKPGLARSPVASPNICVPTPTPFVIHAGLLSR